MSRRIVVVPLLALLVAACAPSDSSDTTEAPDTTERPVPTSGPSPPPLEMTSPAFDEGDPIPVKFTCDGEDLNPELAIVGLPPETVSLTIIVDDPDAPVGVWDHWVEYDINAGPGEFTIDENAGAIGVQGLNSWNLPGYGGPCPPPDQDHRYFFTIHVLNDKLLLPAGIDSGGVRQAMEGKIITEVTLMGTYAR